MAQTTPGYQHPVVKPCGTCSLCCKVMVVSEIGKAAGSWCPRFAKGVGCTVHGDKPSACRDFQCYWSVSEVLGEEWRPDRSKLVLWSDAEGRVIVEVDPSTPSAWKREPFYSALKSWSDTRRPRPLQVLVRVNGRYIVLFPETEIDVGPHQAGMKLDVGYRGHAPFAEWAPAYGSPPSTAVGHAGEGSPLPLRERGRG